MPALDDLCWSFDIQLKGNPAWIPYTRQNFPDATSCDIYPGVTQSSAPGDAQKEIHQALDEALGPIRSHLEADLAGLRIKMWRDDEPFGDPHLMVEATEAQMALSWARHHVAEIGHAEHTLTEYRYTLLTHLVFSYCEGRLGNTPAEAMTTIGTEAAAAPPGVDLEAVLAAARPVYQVQQALARKGHFTFNPGCAHSEYQYEALPTSDIFFWAGPVRFQARRDGTAAVQIDTDAGLDGLNLLPEASEQERKWAQEERQRRDAHALSVAQELLSELTQRNLEPTDQNHQPVGAEELATGRTYALIERGR